jgi:hypothetical protein
MAKRQELDLFATPSLSPRPWTKVVVVPSYRLIKAKD